jgi:hypothetical protein
VRTQFIDMVHPDLPGQVYKAPAQGVGQLARAGWQVREETPPDPPTAPKPTEAPADAGASSLEDTDQPAARRRASEKKGE